ncbi:MAG: S8 family peptidase [Acidobacteriota bacterium]
MIRIWLKAALVALLLLPGAVTAQNFAPGELLVKINAASQNLAFKNRSIEKVGAKMLQQFTGSDWIRVRLPKGMSLDEGIERFGDFPEVEAVQPNFYYHLLATPNDTSFGSLWGMTKISAPSAWDITTGNASVVVAVIDTGIRYTHDDLAANLWRNTSEIPNNSVDDDNNGFVDDYYGWDFRYNDSDPMDENGHGTHTAGTIGAVGNNGLGVVGVNWNVKVMAIKIYSPNGNDTTSAMLIDAYNYIKLMKSRGVNIRVTNNSYGGCAEACGYDLATKEAIDALGDAGILNVFAAGNSAVNIDQTPFYPASYNSPSILTVSSSAADDSRSGFSNYGVVGSDIAAPGSSIYSTYNSSNSSYATLSGTSMATPHVAGAAALLAGYYPNMTVASLKATLMNTVDLLPGWTSLVKSGGRLNVLRALQTPTTCSPSLNMSTANLPTKGGLLSVNLTVAQNCDFRIVPSAIWIKTPSGVSSGSGQVNLWIDYNRRISRSGTVSIGGLTMTVSQSRQ